MAPQMFSAMDRIVSIPATDWCLALGCAKAIGCHPEEKDISKRIISAIVVKGTVKLTVIIWNT